MTMIGTFASRAFTSADTISREPLGVIASAWIPVWIRFSTICICFSTSISRSAACTCSVTPSRSAASCAPRRMSTKYGWFNVFRTSAMVGLPGASPTAPPRLHDIMAVAAIRISAQLVLRTMLPLQHGIEQDRDDDHAADDDLLQKRRDAEQVEAVAQHAHDQRANRCAAKRAFAAHQAGAANHCRGDRVELVHHAGDWLRRVETRG